MIRLFGLRSGNGGGRELLLETALSMYCGLERRPEIARGERGKPWFPERPDLHFNLSHSGPYLLCALSDRPVGVDIEMIRPRGSRLLDRGLTPEERAWCLVEEDPWPRFYTLWTLRESACKRTGRGLTLPVRDISVPLPPEDRLGEIGFRSYWGPGWVAAACGEGTLPDEIQWLET